MNYRHDFHAGNHADVLKHVALVRILLYLQRKPAPYRVIDTHAGSGRYDLASAAAMRTGEWRDGIGRLDPAALPPDARELVQPYLDLVGSAVRGEAPYPGSPALALALARPFDRAMFYELHPEARAALAATIGRDKRAKIMALDGYVGLNASLPPVERRGLVLVDPPFEQADEFDRLTAAVLAAHRKWRDGILMAWVPLKDRRSVERMWAALAGAGVADALRLELAVGAQPEGRLAASALLVINPPWTLAAEMSCLLPALARQLGGRDGMARLDAIAPAPDARRSTR
jgi:23S rRNA (adenine2030-N6)-methyltransferase